MNTNAIVTERLTKRFRRVRTYRDLAMYRWQRSTDLAVEDVSLEIRRGELFGLLGENGAGKTTLIRMISTTLLPSSGRASVLGHDVVRDPYAVRRLIGVVSGDERSFYWRLSGRQNLEYFAALYHIPRRAIAPRISELLDTLDIAHHADRRFDTFSTGTKQRFAIARGMLSDPKVLFLDEPTRALDPIAADELRNYIASHVVGRLGYTALLATHTLSEAEAICHRIAIIRAGRLVEMGTMDELRTRTSLSPVLQLVVTGWTDNAHRSLCAVPEVSLIDVTPDGSRVGLNVRFSVANPTMTNVLRVALDSGLEIESTATRRPTLDDIYRAAHAPI